MRKFILCISVLSLLFGCIACENGKVSRSNVGAVGGGLAGALIGSTVGKGSGKSVAIATGAILGSLAGSALGKLMDERDLELQKNAQFTALEYNKVGSASSWKNPDSQASGHITPTQIFVNHKRENCREYTQTIKIGNKTEEGFGTACRRSDGSWEIIK